MLKVEEISVVGFKPALRGMRNPYDSWKHSDTQFPIMPHYLDKENFESFKKIYNTDQLYDPETQNITFNSVTIPVGDPSDAENYKEYVYYFNPILNIMCFNCKSHDGKSDEIHIIEVDKIPLIGSEDLKLMTKLIRGGTVNSKYARMIVVYMDITASFDFWKEYDTYKVGTVADSCSTMHTITRHKLSIDNFSTADLRQKDIEQIQKNIDYYNNEVLDDESLSDLEKTRIMSKLNLTGFEQKRTVMLSYEVIANMMRWRRGHKLEEWRYLCNQIFINLPYIKPMYVDNKINIPHDEKF